MGTLGDYFKNKIHSDQPAPSYYAPQSGGITAKDRSPLDVLAGQNNTTVNAALQGQLPDAEDAAKVNAAMGEYQKAHDNWNSQMQALFEEMRRDPFNAIKNNIKGRMDALAATEPRKPDLGAIQNQSDRARLLNQGYLAYDPLIRDLASAAAGRGPSQALNQYNIAAADARQQYKSAADQAALRTLGTAASMRGTGGQRAALWQAAMGDIATQNQDTAGRLASIDQQAAEKAAAIGANEQQNARSAEIAALAGQTNVYGNQLYSGTQHQQDMNQNAENEAIALNAKIQSDNAANASQLAREGVKAAGTAAGNISIPGKK